ncbi:MAG: class I SAM-dependent methyltransferase [Cellvibrionaceae bacterium]
MINQKLTDFVQTLLPDARVESISLPNHSSMTPSERLKNKHLLDLYLINEDYPRGKLSDDVAIRLMEQPFYWAFCWASGAVLAQFILNQPEWVEGKCVVDFGCGSGVVAIAAALAGAKEVIACDIDPMALKATRENADLNNVELIYSDDFFKLMSTQNIDLIVAADILYDKDNMKWLDSFTDISSEVLLADSRVKNFSHAGFSKIESVNRCTVPDLDESKEFRIVNVYCWSNHQKA